MFRIVMLIEHKVPNHGLLGPNLYHPTLFVDFLVSRTVVVARKGDIIILIMVNWVI